MTAATGRKDGAAARDARPALRILLAATGLALAALARGPRAVRPLDLPGQVRVRLRLARRLGRQLAEMGRNLQRLT